MKCDILYNTAFLYIPLLAWYAPIWRFIRTSEAALKETVRRRMSSIYRAIFSLFGIFLAAKLLTHLFAYRHVLVWRDFFLFNLPAMLLSVMIWMFGPNEPRNGSPCQGTQKMSDIQALFLIYLALGKEKSKRYCGICIIPF
ncbi:MAG: hypothetical protein HY922_05140 [Elusimicrobia bacterium]|nr:hypothetical protein [Elusimicrobiota bacterium]